MSHYNVIISNDSFNSDLPHQYRLRALQSAILLLPDENREVLQTLLYFLSDIAQRRDENQMPASNLAVCFAPSLFYLRMNQKQRQKPAREMFGSLRRKGENNGKSKITSVQNEHNLEESVAAHHCFTFMIKVNDQCCQTAINHRDRNYERK